MGVLGLQGRLLFIFRLNALSDSILTNSIRLRIKKKLIIISEFCDVAFFKKVEKKIQSQKYFFFGSWTKEEKRKK